MNDDSLLGQIAEDFTRKLREGTPLDIEEYVARHPHLAVRIRELFPTLMLLEGMAEIGSQAESSKFPSALSTGSIFGQYRIECEIGRGGMGIVYEAVHLMLEKRVALKVLLAQTSSSHLERFMREAKTAAGLHHTNIVPVFDVGQIAGIPYFAMQYIEGCSLDQLLRPTHSAGDPFESRKVSADGPNIADSIKIGCIVPVVDPEEALYD